MEFDEILTRIGGLGRVQIVLYILLGILGIPCGMQNLGMVFFGATMDHWCDVPELSHLEPKQVKTIVSAVGEDGMLDGCFMYDLNYSNYSSETLLTWNRTNMLTGVTSKKACTDWHFDTSEFKSTVRSRWNLVCSDSFVKALMQTLYMCGFLVGAVTFGVISDRYGRIITLCICLLLQIIFALAAAVVSVYWHYIAFTILRIVVGMVTAGLFTVTFVLIMEVIPPSHRTYTGLFFQGFFAIGFCLLPGISYALRDLLYTQLAMALPTIILLSYYWFIPESPRWLISKGRYKEAEDILRKIARLNKCPLPDDFTVKSIDQEMGEEDNKGSSLIDVFKKPKLRIRMIVCSYCWFVCGLTYYGISYSAESLGGDIFLNSLISGLVEFPAYIACFFIVGRPKIGRKFSLAGSFFIGGISLLVCIPILNNPDQHKLLIVLANIGKLGSSAAFAIVYIFTAEIFPTVIRTASVGMCSMCARIGSLSASPIMLLWDYWYGTPYIIFGVMGVIGGCLTLLLPESVNEILPETIEDGELFGSKLYHANHTLKQSENAHKMSSDANGNGVDDTAGDTLLEDHHVTT